MNLLVFVSGFKGDDLGVEGTIHAEEEFELKSGLPLEVASVAASYSSWRTTWEQDTLLESPPPTGNVTLVGGCSAQSAGPASEVAFPSALDAVNDMTPRTPGNVNLVMANLTRSRSNVASLASTANAAAGNVSGGASASLGEDRPASTGSPTMLESWRDVFPSPRKGLRRELPQSWRDVAN